MTQTYFGMFRRVAIAWSVMLLDLDQRWTDARSRILDEKAGYGTANLMRDLLGSWMSGLQAWEQTWMPASARAAAVPIVFLKGPNFVGEAALDPPTRTLELQATDLWQAGGPGTIARREVATSITPNGVLKVQLAPKARETRPPGLYRGLVHVDESGTPKVLAEIVVELPLKQD